MKKLFLAAALITIVFFTGGCIQKKQAPMQDIPAPATPVPEPTPISAAQGDSNAVISGIADCEKSANSLDAEACLTKLAKDNLSVTPCTRLKLFSKDECKMPVGVGKKDPGICATLSSEKAKNFCYRDVGIADANISACDSIKNDSNASDACLGSVSRAVIDQKGCLRISDYAQKDTCLLYVASQKSDPSLCGKISGGSEKGVYTRDTCYATADTNRLGETCFRYIAQGERQNCFLRAANKPEKSADCTTFPDKASVDNCNYWLGTRTPDTGYCYKLDGNFSAQCLSFIVSSRPPIDSCLSLKNYRERNSCMKQGAIDANSGKSCEMITSDSLMKDDCLSQVAAKIADENLCAQITRNNITTIDACISAVALSTRQAEKCELTKGDEAYYGCFSAIAAKYNSAEICSLAKKTEFRLLPYKGSDYCFKDYARKMKDSLICDRISVSDLKKQCQDGVLRVLKCVSGDGVCDTTLCDYTNDKDCKSPFYCDSDARCSDNLISTKDSCDLSVHACVNSPISDCTSGDNYCPSSCTYTGDPDKKFLDPANTRTNEDPDCPKPCSQQSGSELCSAGFYCPVQYRIYALEQGCCQKPGTGTNCQSTP